MTFLMAWIKGEIIPTIDIPLTGWVVYELTFPFWKIVVLVALAILYLGVSV